MQARDAWAVLGIAPTDDARAVRRAYSARLKTIDVDADPQGFIDLRAAFETANHIVEGKAKRTPKPILHDTPAPIAAPPPPPMLDPAQLHPDERASPTSEPPPTPHPPTPAPNYVPAVPAPASPWKAAPDARADAFAAIERELRRRKRSPDPAAMLATADVLLAPHALERIDHATDTEAWFTRTIVHHLPRSDPLIAPAIRAFGWHKLDHPAGAVGDIVARYRATRWLEGATGFRRAHQALADPDFVPPGRIARWRRQREVRDLLKAIDETHPSLEADLNGEAVAWWREHRDRARLRWRDWGAIAAIALFVWVALDSIPETKRLSGFPELLGAALIALGFAIWRLRVQVAADGDERWDQPPFTPREAAAAVLSFALPLIAVAGGGAGEAIAFTVFGLLAGAATILVGRRFEWGVSDEIAKRRRWSPMLSLPFWGVVAIDMPPYTALVATLPFVCAAVTAHALYFRLDAWVQAQPVIEDGKGAPALLIALAALVAAGTFGALGSAAVPLALTGAPILLLAQYLLTRGLMASGAFTGWGLWVAVLVGARAILQYAPKGESEGVAQALVVLVIALTGYRAVLLVLGRHR